MLLGTRDRRTTVPPAHLSALAADPAAVATFDPDGRPVEVRLGGRRYVAVVES
jgi:hypothetical protein